MRSAFYLLTIIAVVWSLRTIEVIPEVPARRAAADRRPVRAHVADRLELVSEGGAAALMETMHTATLGTILAVAAASPWRC
jgi:phosphonate transport system permease protein